MKKFSLGIVLVPFFMVSQNLFVTKTVTDNSMTTEYLSEVNTTNGSIISTNFFSQNSNPSLIPSGLEYDNQTNSIFSFSENIVYEHDGTNFTPINSFQGLTNAPLFFREIIHLNNRIFATKLLNTGGMNYELTLFELSKIDNFIINSHTWEVTIATNGYGSTKSDSTNEIFIILGNKLLKYNILTEALNTFTLDGQNLGVSYKGIIFADNRLFIRKDDYTGNQSVNYIIELNKNNGSIISTNQLTSNFMNYYPSNDLVYLNSTKEIACLFITDNDNMILKYNITNHNESLLMLPTENNTSSSTENYRELVSKDSEQSLSNNQIEATTENSKIKNVYNLLGQKISLETYNQVIIIEYENGERIKKMQYSN